MNEQNMPQMQAPTPSAVGLAGECTKEPRPRDVSYIERNPASQVVLSPRLEQACRRVGGCQTDELIALVRQVMYEVISQRKY